MAGRFSQHMKTSLTDLILVDFSQTGKRLMAKCRMLLQENEELGKVITSGRTAKLEGEIAVQKQLVDEMKGNQSELDEFLGDLEEDVEGMQSMIYVLQQQLKDTKDQVTKLEEENSKLKSSNQTHQHSPSKTHSVHTPKVSHSSFSTSPSRDSHNTPVKQEPEIDTPIHVKQEVMCERTSTTHITTHDHEIEDKFHPHTNCEEMMETDQDSKEINHVSYSTSQKLHPTSDPRLHPSSDRTKYTDYRDDSSQDGWSTPTHDTKDDFNGEKQTEAMDSTPEMDRPSDKGFPVGGDLIPNGVNRTPTEEIGEA